MTEFRSSAVPFEYLSGDAALDLVNTVDWTEHGPVNERLTDFARLTRWAEGAGVITAKAAGSLRLHAVARPREAEVAYRRTVRVREVLERLFSAIARGEPAGPALEEFNRVLTISLGRMRVTPVSDRRTGRPLRLGWKDLGENLESIIWPVLWSAASLLVSDEVERIRICGGKDCGWMYVDRSRNGLRRWCQMKTCGTREKSRRRYQRTRRPPLRKKTWA